MLKGYIDITSNKFLLYNNNITTTNKTTPNIMLKLNDNNIQFAHMEKNIIIIGSQEGNKVVTKMPTYSINNKSAPINMTMSSYLGFGRKFLKNEDSLVEVLYSTGIISVKQFSILYTYPDSGKLTLGSLSTFNQDSFIQYSKTCNAVETSNIKWACQLYGVFFGEVASTTNSTNYDVDPIVNKPIKIDSLGYFSTMERYIIVPFKFIQFLRQHYFKDALDNGNCTYIEKPIGQLTTFECEDKAVYGLKPISFSFGDFALIYHVSKLFTKAENSTRWNFNIASNRLNDDWTLGVGFISFFLTTFNYERNQVSFFSLLGKLSLAPVKYNYDINDPLLILSDSSVSYISFLLKILIGVNILGLIITSWLIIISRISICD